MIKNSAFWREVIEYLPHLLFLFRVDESDQAHLIFANKNITEILGYTPREYILQSETDSKISQELSYLVDEIARRSYDVEEITPRPCILTSRQGQSEAYEIDFQLFSTSAQKSNLIAVVLRPSKNIQDPVTQADDKEQEVNQPDKQPEYKPIYKSALMQSVVQKGRQLLQSPGHLLIRGETGTGKRTLAAFLLKEQAAEHQMVWYREPASEIMQQITSGRKNFGMSYLLVERIDKLTKEKQEGLKEIVSSNRFDAKGLKIIATSRRPLENLVERDEFDATLYYGLAFSTLLVPPLRQHPDEVVAVAKSHLKTMQALPGIPQKAVAPGEFEKLKKHHWDHNYYDLYEVLNNAIVQSGQDKITFKIAAHTQSSLFPEEHISAGDVLSFDEMTRRYLERILEITAGKIYGDDGAANLIDLKPTTLQSKLKKLGVR